MSRINNLIKELCPNGVEYVKLGELVDYIQPAKYIVKDTNYDIKYDVPVLTAGQTFVLGYTNEKDGICYASADNPVIIFDDFTTSNHWVDFNFKVKSSAMKILISKTDNLFKYIYYCISNIDYVPKEHSRQWIQVYSQFQIPLPPLKVQEEIVRILDKFGELEAELEARKSQYEFWRDKIFKFENRSDVKWLKLKDIKTEIHRGNGIKRNQVTDDGIPCVRYGEIYTTYDIWFNDCKSHTFKDVVSNPKTFTNNDLLFAITGESVEEISKTIAYTGNDVCYAGGDIVVMKHNQNGKYLSYTLSTKDAVFQKGKGKVKSKVVHSSVPSIEEIIVPIVSLEEQDEIVEKLDYFYNIINDISCGLPAEIELRRKQYEYYRNKLLSFE